MTYEGPMTSLCAEIAAGHSCIMNQIVTGCKRQLFRTVSFTGQVRMFIVDPIHHE